MFRSKFKNPDKFKLLSLRKRSFLEKYPNSYLKELLKILSITEMDLYPMCLLELKRMILYLKSLNEFVAYQHFKMDDIQTAVKLVRPQCFMVSVDLKDAYYSVPVAPEDRTFLKFEWEGQYYQYTCLPNGLACAPRLFTKIIMPIYARLHSLGHISMGHIDAGLIFGRIYLHNLPT